jgi:predicted dehydrogenase
MIGYGEVTEVKSGPGLYKADHSALLGVAGRSPDKALAWTKRHQVARAYASPEDLLADPAIDAVYIATPPSTHKEYALQAARAGKHVCVEKPMALRPEECGEIVEACAQAGVRLYVAFYRRAMPRFLRVKQWLDAGLIGAALTVRVVQHQPPAGDDVNGDALP